MWTLVILLNLTQVAHVGPLDSREQCEDLVRYSRGVIELTLRREDIDSATEIKLRSSRMFCVRTSPRGSRDN